MEQFEILSGDGLKIYQDDSLYRFTSDSILLSKFATVKKGDVAADFCSGSGIVGFNLYNLHRDIKSMTFFEMQKPLFDLSIKSVVFNGLSDKFLGENIKIQDIGKEYSGKFSLIVCNPPYMEKGRGFADNNDVISVCRTEAELTLNELLIAASHALKFGGRFAMVNRADRLVDIFTEMREVNIEPKRIQFVSGGDKPPYLVLVEGVKGGKRGIKILKNIVN